MRKNILGILAMVMAFVMIGSVSALSFNVPTASGSYAGTLNVSWANPDSSSTYTLQYRAGDCIENATNLWHDLTSMTGQIPSNYAWNTKTGIKAVNDGLYCLRLRVGGVTGAISGLFTIDNHAPQVDIHETTVPYPGADEKSNPVRVLIDYGDSVDSTPTCKINWNDGTALQNCPATGLNSEHQYGDNGNYKVIVTVSDDAGNSASDYVTVAVKNVDPTVGAITTDLPAGRNDVALGQAVTFDAVADDVDADLEAGLTCKWTFDSTQKTTTADEDGNCEIEYTWTHASTHTVDLTVMDKDGGSVDAEQYTIEVLAPEHMTPMQQVVANSPFEFNLDSSWASVSSTNFKTSFTDAITCEKVSGPTSMTNVVGSATVGECSITWTPTKDDKGEHSVIIRVNDATSYAYYSFDVTVYSWGIQLNKGWNLISVPYVPTDSDIKKVFADILPNIAYESNSSTILQYDATYNNNEGKWYKAKPNSAGTGFTGTVQDILPGYGYWVKMDKADTLYGIEENFNPGQVLMPSVDLATQSWNLVGRYGINPTQMLPNDAFESLEGHYYENSIYESTDGNSYSKADTIDLGKGYWVRTTILPDGLKSIKYEPISYYFNEAD
jgi:hypothetical protein